MSGLYEVLRYGGHQQAHDVADVAALPELADFDLGKVRDFFV
jgi:hypothetical protein